LNRWTPWLRVVGGGCFVNAAVTGILVGMFSAVSSFNLDAILIPFLVGATASFGLSLYLLRQSPGDPLQGSGEVPVMRKVILAGFGVFLGSIFAVLGIAAFILLSGI
jgi:hypothetical protein